MPLGPGTRLGPYEILWPIGAGGMGEVYKATDTNLKRAVAIKVLPASLAGDAERLARFQREAEVLAALNHPNIAQIHGLEKSDGTIALVMELVEGEDLSQRIARGPIPLDEALPIARQIAEALEAAHEQGIIHRDLKPANIKVREDGTVKVLDFGLAKLAGAPGGTPSTGALSLSPTITSPAMMTGVGVLLGTAAYMSPEQAKGREADKRSDIWAFGCVLFEMLTGRRAFEGEDVSDTLAAVLRGEPDWNALPAEVPLSIRTLLTACLAKNARQRIADISAGLFVINHYATLAPAMDAPIPTAPVKRVSLGRRVLASAAAVIVTAGVVGYAAWTMKPAPPRSLMRVAITLPADQQFSSTNRHVLALSPAGTHLVYVANSGLYLRALDRLDAAPIRGTEGGGSAGPFFSPDGQWIGFWHNGQLKKVSVSGGAPVKLCDAPIIPWGASWGADNTILYGEGGEAILSVPGGGGTPEVRFKAEEGEQLFGPQQLPGDEWVLFTVLPKEVSSWDEAQIVAQSLRSGERRVLITGGHDARYMPTGHLVYGLKGTLLAVPFDSRRLEVTGSPVPLVEDIPAAAGTGATQFSVSGDGTLVYAVGIAGIGRGTPVWVARDGRELTPLASAPLEDPRNPRLSPDGRKLALVLGSDVWVYDLGGRPPIKLPFEGAHNAPMWTPDGRRLIYEIPSPPTLLSIPADGSAGTPERVSPEGHYHLHGWSSDGREMVVVRFSNPANVPGGGDIMKLLIGEKGKPEAVVQTQYNEGGAGAALSPDGRWLAYASDQTGQQEIWVRPYPGPGAPIRVSPNGGVEPVWAKHGRELYYREGSKLMSVAVDAGAGFNFKVPSSLFESRYRHPALLPTYDVALDGRFVMIKAAESQATTARIVIVQNWLEELKRLVPTK